MILNIFTLNQRSIIIWVSKNEKDIVENLFWEMNPAVHDFRFSLTLI